MCLDSICGLIMATYSDLRAALINTTENDGTEFTAEIPNFISRAELRLTKDIDDVGLDEYSAITLTASNAVVSLGDRVRIVPVSYTHLTLPTKA